MFIAMIFFGIGMVLFFISGETHRRVAMNRDFCTFQPDVKYNLPLKALSHHDAYDWN